MSTPRKLDRKWRGEQPKPPTNHRSGWREQEASLPQLQPGGRLQRGSGNGRGAGSKGDSIGDLFLISGKSTRKASISVKREDLEAIAQQAHTIQLRPALSFGFDREDGTPREDWLALRQGDQQLLIDIAVAVHEGDTAQAQALTGLLFS